MTHADWKSEAADEYRRKRAALLADRRMHADAIEERRRAIDGIDAEIANLELAAKTFGLPLPEFERPEEDVAPDLFDDGSEEPRGFKDVALSILEEAYPQPVRAADLAKTAETILHKRFHEKTAGMTLYRLSRDHIVRREGHRWYWIPPDERQNRALGRGLSAILEGGADELG